MTVTKSDLQGDKPYVGLFLITPSNTNDLGANVTRAIYVGTSGDLHIIMADGSEVTLPDVAAGIFHPLRVLQVFATGTGALDIFGAR